MRTTSLGGGYSGCEILLCEEDDDWCYVKKISKDISYNSRLRVQSEKQRNFTGKELLAPKVLSSGFTQEGLYFFDMEYIQGITLAEYMKTIEIGRIRNCVDILFRNIVQPDAERAADTDVFEQKITSVEKLLENRKNPVTNEAFSLLKKHDWSGFSNSDCHGDLTLENIIVRDHQYYVIDFLDSFYDSWIMDISTLMQDVQTMWAYRKEEPDMNTLIRLIIFRDLLADRIKNMTGRLYADVYYALLLKLIRIYPYAQDAETLQFLNQKTRTVMGIIEKAELE